VNTVVMLLSNTAGSVGGTQRQADLLAAELGGRGMEVVVVSKSRRLLPAPGSHMESRVRTRQLPTLPWLPAWSLLASFLAWAAVHRRRIAVIHAHSTSAGVIAGIVGRLLGKPVVVKVTEMKYAEHLARADRRPGLQRRVLAGTAGAVIALSEEMRQALARAGLGDRVAVIPNGVAIPTAVPEARRAALRAEWLGARATSVVVCVARLTPRKRIDALLGVWRVLDREDAMLVIVGDGPQRARLEAEAAGCRPGSVRFVGTRDDVTPFYRMADVFVLPSRSEGLSNALLEAMAAGLPPVVADIGGNREVVEDGVNALLVDWSDRAASAGALRRLLDDGGLRRRLGEAARRRAADFAIGIVADRYCALYRALQQAEAA
jgi:glycosyltransferase involved in cell wall biosynthesis